MNWKDGGTVVAGVTLVGGALLWLGALNQRVGAMEDQLEKLSSPASKLGDICVGLSSAWAQALPKGAESAQAVALNEQMERFRCADLATVSLNPGIPGQPQPENAAMTVSVCELTEDERKLFDVREADLADCPSKKGN